MTKFFIIILFWNVFVTILYGRDKLKAKKGKRRIRESTLLICSFFLGGMGAVLGMVIFNHKTLITKRKSGFCPLLLQSNAVVFKYTTIETQ